MTHPALGEETMSTVEKRLEAIEGEAASLRELFEAAALSHGDRAYILRCFDLLEMELRAMRQFLVSLT